MRKDLSECSAVWSWGIRNSQLPDNATNPFAGILPPKAAKRTTTRRPFTDAEAAAILQQARKSKGVLRWLPWVCCLTGARISEIVQSVREDMAEVDGVTVLRIHDEGEGRGLKNTDSRRTVPLHPALIREGFADYVRSLPAGSPLFPDVRPDKLFNRHATEAGRKVSRWLRGKVGITDPRIAPNHSWRHFFIDSCRRVSMPLEVRSALTGHSARLDESASYGGGVRSMVQLMADAIAKVELPPGVSAVTRRLASRLLGGRALPAAPLPPLRRDTFTRSGSTGLAVPLAGYPASGRRLHVPAPTRARHSRAREAGSGTRAVAEPTWMVKVSTFAPLPKLYVYVPWVSPSEARVRPLKVDELDSMEPDT